jgi:ATP-binding cassette subfamily C protein
VVIVAHRPSALAQCDKVLLLANGVQQAYGPRDEILKKILPPKQPAAAAPAGLKVVRDVTSGADR